MAFSLEARVPYLDYRLIEYLLGIPGTFKVYGGETKYLQKISLGKYTVEEILNRTDKIGFGTPGEEWMRTDAWKKHTSESYQSLLEAFPGVFKRDVPLPRGGFHRWKICQLATWKDVFLS